MNSLNILVTLNQIFNYLLWKKLHFFYCLRCVYKLWFFVNRITFKSIMADYKIKIIQFILFFNQMYFQILEWGLHLVPPEHPIQPDKTKANEQKKPAAEQQWVFRMIQQFVGYFGRVNGEHGGKGMVKHLLINAWVRTGTTKLKIEWFLDLRLLIR